MKTRNLARSCAFLKKNNLLALLVIASLALSIACGRQQSSETANIPQATSPEKETQVALAEPFKLGDVSFSSQQAFVENITPRCATEEPPPAERRVIERSLERMKVVSPQERAPGSVEIPVYFHVLTNSAGSEGNISDADVQRQIDVLNVAYAGNGPGGIGASTPFRFKLIAVDRTANDEWFNMAYSPQPTPAERAAKAGLNKGGKSALNIYTARIGDKTLGWARWPWDVANGVDGVVIRYSTLPGGGSEHYNEGDTATHEVGHWLGLFHTFQGGCEDPGDEVDDTASERSPAAGCPVARDTCPQQSGGDPVDNFMDYSNDSCMFNFTRGQSARMDDAHLKYHR